MLILQKIINERLRRVTGAFVNQMRSITIPLDVVEFPMGTVGQLTFTTLYKPIRSYNLDSEKSSIKQDLYRLRWDLAVMDSKRRMWTAFAGTSDLFEIKTEEGVVPSISRVLAKGVSEKFPEALGTCEAVTNSYSYYATGKDENAPLYSYVTGEPDGTFTFGKS